MATSFKRLEVCMNVIGQQAIRPRAHDKDVRSKGRKASRSKLERKMGCISSIKIKHNESTRRPILSHLLVNFLGAFIDANPSLVVIFSTHTDRAMKEM